MSKRQINLNRPMVIHYSILGLALVIVWLTQVIPAWGRFYSEWVYPPVSWVLSACSGWIPFSLGDLFIFLSLAWVVLYPVYGAFRKLGWKKILRQVVTYLAWVYVWFYLAWGLNYSQPNFYQRTQTPHVAYTSENFRGFLKDYIGRLNTAFIPIAELETMDKRFVHKEIIGQYNRFGNELGVHLPKGDPRVKTMMFYPLFSKMAITGYMGPFFCEFNVNGDLLQSQYPETYAHELAHWLGISGEAEANFYAYQMCTRSEDPRIRYCGYFSVLNHVLGNTRMLLSEEEYKELLQGIRKEIIEQAIANREYWMAKYSPAIGSVQDWIYDIYLKGNKIESGRKNYSQVVGLLVNYNLSLQSDLNRNIVNN